MSFQFVENGKIDGATRRKIRSHVMKGKNAGKTRTRAARPGDGPGLVSLSTKTDVYEYGPSYGSSDSDDNFAWISRPIGDPFSYFTFPVKMQPYMKELIYPCEHNARAILSNFVLIILVMVSQLEAIYPLQFCMPTDFMKSIWFQYMLSSEACKLSESCPRLPLIKVVFYCVLALSEQVANLHVDRDEISLQRLHHLANTYRLINRDLEKTRIPSDSTIAVTVSLTIHEDLRYQFGTTKMHLNALERMVNLRGGLDRFSENWILSQKLCR